MKKFCLSLFVSIITVSFVVVFYTYAWTEPTQAPPGGNVPAPINVGLINQTKSGGITAGSLASSGVLLVGTNAVVNNILTVGSLKMAAGAGSNKVLTSDANGNATWQTPTGGGAGNGLGSKDCYMFLPSRWSSGYCIDGFYVKAMYKVTDHNWDGYGIMCCRADSSVDSPSLPDAATLRSQCPWGRSGVTCGDSPTQPSNLGTGSFSVCSSENDCNCGTNVLISKTYGPSGGSVLCVSDIETITCYDIWFLGWGTPPSCCVCAH